ncbi:MAG: hypothetical protein GXX95_02250 [Methanomassiliicoccus sp.]|nr:hypothetical protein [Methanomassiliicoccus sp.]
MLATTHLLFALILIGWFGLDRKAAFAVLLFGVLIDIDHVLGMAEFVAKEGVENSLNLQAALSSDVQWKSLLHSPQAVLFVAPVVLGFRMVLPLVAWSAHLLMDYVQMNYLGICSPAEMFLMGLMALVLLHMRRAEFSATSGDPSLKGLIVHETTGLATLVSALPVLRSLKKWITPLGSLW